MKKLLFFAFLFLVTTGGYSQDLYTAISNGNWNNAATWSCQDVGGGCDTAVPGGDDLAGIPSGISVTLNVNASVGGLFVQYDNPSALLACSGFCFGSTLTINGELVGFDFGSGSPTLPTVNVFPNSSRLSFRFTNDRGVGAVITSWSHSAPLNNVTFDPTSSSTNISIEDLAVFGGRTVQVIDGTLTINNGYAIADPNGGATFTLNTGANLVVNGAINGGTTNSNFNLINLSGTTTTGTSGYINANDFNLGANANFTVNFNGANQAEGWWYGSNNPTSVTIDPTSTIRFTASANQNIPALPYGNLVLNSSTASVTKTLQSVGSFSTQDFSINNSNVTFVSSGNPNAKSINGNFDNLGIWNAANQVTFRGDFDNLGSFANSGVTNFSGGALQNIEGGMPPTFGGGLNIINNTTVALSTTDINIDGNLDIASGSTLDPSNDLVLLSADLILNGQIVTGTGSGGFNFDGTTSISGSGTYDFNNIIITGTLNAPPGNLFVTGNFTNNGTFNNNNGTVDFVGNDPQAILGSSTTTFENIIVANTTNFLTVQVPANLAGLLTFASSSNFNANGNLTLLSDATGTATVTSIPASASVTGNFIYQRYWSGNQLNTGYSGAYWRNWGSPVGGTVSDLTNAGLQVNDISLAVYDESDLGTVNDGWVLLGDAGWPGITDIRGYSQWMYQETADVTVSFTGPLNTGSVNFGVTYSDSPNPVADDGWNLVSNPYASPIDWGATTGWTKTNVASSAAVWDGVQYNYLDGSTTGQTIASGQGFWVQTVASSPVLTATQAVKTNAAATLLRTGTGTENRMLISLKNEEFTDVAYIKFVEEATEEFDPAYDAFKLQNAIFNFSSLTEGGQDLAINSVPFAECNRSMPLNVTNINPGAYKIEFTDLGNTTAGYAIALRDNFTGDLISVNEGGVYEFEVTADEASFGGNRFVLEFEAAAINNQIDYQPAMTESCDNFVTLNLNNTQVGPVYEVLDQEGNVISEAVGGNGGSIGLSISKDNLDEGLNNFRLRINGKEGCSTDLILNDFISFTPTPAPQVSNVTSASFCGEASVTLTAEGAENGSAYRWYATETAPSPLEETTLGEFSTPALSRTTTYFVSVVNALGCESNRVPVHALKSTLSAPQVSDVQACEGSTASLNATGAVEGQFYKWYASSTDSDPITENSDGIFVTPEIEGSVNYYVSVATAAGCESEKVPVAVSVNRPEIPEIQVNGLEMVIETGEAYQWYLDGEPIEGATSATFIAQESGEYQVEVTVDGCTVFSTSRTFIVASTDDELYQLGLSVYPNPVRDKINLQPFTNDISLTDFEISLFDGRGTQIKSTQDLENRGNSSYLEVNDLKPGMYILNIFYDGEVFALKISKQ